MKNKPFFDTNVLIYFAAEKDEAKADEAEALIAKGGTVSVQVLNEAALVCRRKLGYNWARTHLAVGYFRGLLEVTAVTIETHDLGLEIASRYQLRIYDSMLLASALLAGCDVFWSEDLQNGMLIEDRLTIWNPFVQP